jgi:nucleoside-diphosphate-sugar epimerase
MVEMAERGMLAQPGPATNYYSSIYVPDAGQAVAAALGLPAGVYNVTDDEPVTFAKYLRALAGATGTRTPRRLPGVLGRMMFGEVWKYFLAVAAGVERAAEEGVGMEAGGEERGAGVAAGRG